MITTTLLCAPVAAVRPGDQRRAVAVAAPVSIVTGARLRAASAPARTSVVSVMPAVAPAIDGAWLGGLVAAGIDAQAAKHDTAVDPPRGISV
jgi:nitrous oxidase accessory protein NosD